MYVSVKKTIPKETPKRPIQCTECNSTFDARHKLKEHTREQHEGKLVKSPEWKSPKTNIKISNSNKEEFKVQVTAEGEEMIVKIVTMDFKKMENLQDVLTQTGQENEQLKSDIIKLNWL